MPGIKYGSPAWMAGLSKLFPDLRITGASRAGLWKIRLTPILKITQSN
jgi:hypothetical protein